MNKLPLIIKREFLAKVRNKSFIIMTILSPLLIVALFALVVFLNQKNSEDVRKIAFVDESGLLSDAFQNSKKIEYINITKEGLQKAKQQTKDLYYGLVHVKKTTNLNELPKKITFFSSESPGMGLLKGIETQLEKKIQHLKMDELNIDFEIIKQTKVTVNLTTENFEGDKSSKVGSLLRMFAGGGFGYLIFMFIIIYGTSVMRSVIEEKTSRIIEVIISSVKPFQLMLGKILGNAFAGILQFLIWMTIGGFLLFSATYIFGIDSPQTNVQAVEQLQQASTQTNMIQEVLLEIKKLPIMTIFFSFIIYFLGGYLIYSSIYAAIGAAVDNETDTQQFMTPVLLPLIVAIYIGFSVIENPHGSIAVGFSIFPLTSPIVMLMRIPFGVPWWEIALSMALLLITFLGIVWFAAKIYRIGILMYGKKPTYKELIKWLKY